MKKQHATTRIMAAMPGTQREISEATDLSLPTISRWIVFLRDNGDCHIGGWKRSPTGGPFMQVLHTGFGADVLCKLKPVTDVKRATKSRRNSIASGAWEDARAKERARYWLSKKPKRCALTAAFFGAGRA